MAGETVGNGGEQQNQNTGASALENMPSFEEHMQDVETKSSNEKYRQQAEVEKSSWIERAQAHLAEVKALRPEDVLAHVSDLDGHSWKHTKENGFEYRMLNESNPEDMAKFNEYKASKVQHAERGLRKDESVDLDKLTKYCENREIIGKIAKKLENGEDLSEKETRFLGDGPDSDNEIFDMDKFLTPDTYYVLTHGLMVVPSYKDLLDPSGREGYPEWATVADAQMREMARRDQVLLHDSTEVQTALRKLETRGSNDDFSGETNLNSATGEARTFTVEDNYPQLEGESDAEYANRLKRIGFKTRLAEKRQ